MLLQQTLIVDDWINYKASLYKQTTRQNKNNMHICNQSIQMASVEIFNNSRNLRVFINWQFPIFIKNRQALLLTTIGFLKVQNSSFEVDPKCRQTSHSYSTLHREKAKRCLKLNQTTINRIACDF